MKNSAARRRRRKSPGLSAVPKKNEEECFRNIRELLSYLPQSNREKLPPQAKTADKANCTDETLFEIIPDAPNRPYDMKKIIERIFDKREDDKKNYFELFPLFATNIITCFSRLNGWSVGIIANQPMSKAGCLDIDACDKASRFIRFCDAFNIPVINLVDVPVTCPAPNRNGAASSGTAPRCFMPIPKLPCRN